MLLKSNMTKVIIFNSLTKSMLIVFKNPLKNVEFEEKGGEYQNSE